MHEAWRHASIESLSALGTRPEVGTMDLALYFLARSASPLAAYLALQSVLLRHYVARGGRPEEFVRRYGAAFRRRFGWMCVVRSPTGDAFRARVDG